MRRFEVGKRYEDGGFTFEVVRRTAKFVTLKEIRHAGRFNETVKDIIRLKVYEWPTGEEVFLSKYGFYEVHA